MSRVFGAIDDFDPKAVEWELYETRFSFFLEANAVTDDKQKRALLLASIGMNALSYVRDLNQPTALNDNSITYTKLVEQLRAHFGKKTAVRAGRSEFTNIRQKEDQSVEDFAAALRAAAVHCKFDAELDVRLRDQFVIGLRTDAVRKRLMEKDDITFPEALKQASNLERIAKDSKQVGRGESSVSKVVKGGTGPGSKKFFGGGGNRQQGQTPIQQSGANSYSQQHHPLIPVRNTTSHNIGCWSCGRNDHRRNNCAYHLQGLKCRACGKAGHKATVCHQQNHQPPRQPPHGGATSSRKVHAATTEVEESDSLALQKVAMVGVGVQRDKRTYVVKPIVNGVAVVMDLDTCAEVTIVSSDVYDQLRRPTLEPAPKLRAYGGAEIPTLGQAVVNVEYKGQRKQLPLVFVTSPQERGLFGRPWIEAFNAVSVNTVGAESRLSSLLQEFADVFETTTGCIKEHKAHLHFKPNAQFRINKPRPVPYAFRPAVEAELERLAQQNVITAVDVAEFTTTPLVVVPKPNGTVRL